MQRAEALKQGLAGKGAGGKKAGGGGKAKSRVEVWGTDVIGRKKSTTDIKAS